MPALVRSFSVAAVVGTFVLASAAPSDAGVPRPGSQDLHFGVNGVTRLLPDPRGEYAPADPVGVALSYVQGKVWVGAEQSDGAYVRPLTASGRAVKTFAHGKPVLAIEDDLDFLTVRSLLPTPDGGAIAVSQIDDAGQNELDVSRLKPSGASSWSTRVSLCGDCTIDAAGATLLADGRVRIMEVYNPTTSQSWGQAAVVGLTAAGAPDASVGPGGLRVAVGSPTNAPLEAAGSDAQGRLYFVEIVSGQPQVFRTSERGVLDTTYGDHGIASIDIPSRSAVTPDRQFNLYGPFAQTSLQVSPSGEVYIGTDVDTATHEEAAVFHLNTAGRLVTTFGTNGFAYYRATGGDGSISALRADGRGHLVLALTYSDPSRFLHLLLRVSSTTGAVDRSFGRRGAAATSVYVSALARGPGHLLYVLGWPTYGRSNLPVTERSKLKSRSEVMAFND
jgi:hypothetical protein